MIGYRSPFYAEALSDLGRPHHLAGCDGWLIERPVPGTQLRDAIGCYPLFCCADWPSLGRDLELCAERAVAVSLVIDPFCPLDRATLAEYFPGICRPYKEHAVVRFKPGWRTAFSSHHRRNIRLAARRVAIECHPDPTGLQSTWIGLYETLVRRHDIQGLARFSKSSLARQLAVPGIAVFRATIGDETVGMLLWYIQDHVAYYHLGAFSALGYASRAAFALFDVALGDLSKRGVSWACLGGAAGWNQTAEDGLTRFKTGWCNDRRMAWFCGRILDPESYGQLVSNSGIHRTDFFPAYRRPAAA